MSSMPLPALHVNPPADPAEGMQRILAMKGMLQQQQMQNVQLQQQQLQLKDQQALRGLFVKHSGDLDKVIQDAPMAGVSPQTIQQLQLHNVDVKTKTADLVAKQGDNAVKQADLMAGAHSTVDSAPADQKPAVYQQQLQALQKMGVDVSQMPPQYPGDDEFKLVGALVKGHKQQVEDAFKAAETAKNAAQTSEATARAGEATAQTAKVTTENANLQKFGGMSPAMAESRYLSVQTKLNQGMPVSPDDKAFKAAYEKNRTLVPAFNIKMQNSDGGIGPTGGAAAAGGGSTGAGTGTGAPKDPAAQVPGMLKGSVEAVLDYRSPMPPQGRNNARNNAIRDWVNKIDPTYDETTFPARNKILTEYVKSAGNGPIGAINTALGHLGELNEAAKALDKNDVPLLHSIASKVGAAVGDDAATTYTSILHRVGPEMTSAYVQGGGGQAERGANEEDFAVSKGQKQILSNIGESAKLLRSKMSSLENNWNQTFRPANDNQKFESRFITPQAKATLNAVSAQAPGGTVMMKAPNGQTKAIPADQVEHYKALGAVPVSQ